eukprot:364398-Chlamydomonas_euryale.AAC.10
MEPTLGAIRVFLHLSTGLTVQATWCDSRTITRENLCRKETLLPDNHFQHAHVPERSDHGPAACKLEAKQKRFAFACRVSAVIAAAGAP